MGKRSEVIFGNRMSGQVVKKAENSKERFVKDSVMTVTWIILLQL